MKIKDGFMLQTVAGNTVVVPVGEKSITFRGMLTLNEVGAFVWKELQSENTCENIAKKITEEYSVDFETALKDVNVFVEKLREKDIIDG